MAHRARVSRSEVAAGKAVGSRTSAKSGDPADATTVVATDADAYLAALSRGAAWATDEAWRRYAPMVHGVLRRGLGPGADVDDATQEVFLRLFRRVGTLRDANALRAFVLSVTVRVMKWQLRRRLIRRWVRLSGTGELPEVAAPTMDDDGREALRRVYAILDLLKPLDRTIFVLRQSEKLSLPEIARAVALSLSTVKRRLGRVGPRVRRLIEADPLLATYLSQGGFGVVEEVDDHE